MRMFPGRTLEELDGMDFARLQRATEAGNIERIEELRRQSMKGKYKPSHDEYRRILEHDQLYRRFYGRQDALPDPGPQRSEPGSQTTPD
mgnify:FL=1